MNKIILLSALAFMIVGCGETSGDSRGDTTITNTTVDSGGGDVTINDVEVSDEGTYIYNNDGTVTFTTGSENNIDAADGDSNDDGTQDVEVGVYDPAYDQADKQYDIMELKNSAELYKQSAVYSKDIYDGMVNLINKLEKAKANKYTEC